MAMDAAALKEAQHWVWTIVCPPELRLIIYSTLVAMVSAGIFEILMLPANQGHSATKARDDKPPTQHSSTSEL